MNVVRLSVGRIYCRVVGVVIVGWLSLFLSVQVYTVCDAFISPSSIGLPRRKVTTNSKRRGESSLSLVAILPAGAGSGGAGDIVSIYVVDPPSAPSVSTTADGGMLDSVTSLDSAILSQYVLIGGVVISISIVLAAIAFYASTSTSNDQQDTPEEEEEKKKIQDATRRVDTTTTDINKSEAQRELAAMEANWKNKVEGTAAELLSSDTTAEETRSSNRVATTTTTVAIADDTTNTRDTRSSAPAAPPQFLDSSSSEETTIAKREKVEDNENDEDDSVVVVVDNDDKQQQQPTQSGRSLFNRIKNIRSKLQVTTKEIDTNTQQLKEEKKNRIDLMSKTLLSSKGTREITDIYERDELLLMDTIQQVSTVTALFERKKQQRRIVDIKLSKVSTTNSLLEEEYQDEQTSTQQLATDLTSTQDTLLDTQNQYQLKQQELISTQKDVIDIQNKITLTSESLTELQDEDRSIRTLGKKIWNLSKRRVSQRIPNVVKNRFKNRKRSKKKQSTSTTSTKAIAPSPLSKPDDESQSISIDKDNNKVDTNVVAVVVTDVVEKVDDSNSNSNSNSNDDGNKIVTTTVPTVMGTNKRLFFNSLDTMTTLNVATQARTKLLQKMVDEKRIVDVKKTQQLIDNKENENDNENEREIIIPTISYDQPGSIETFLATLPPVSSSSSASSQSQPIAAGTWKVIYAPHMTTIANLLKGTLDVTYHLSADQTIVSHAYYDFPFVGTGYLSVSGTYGNVLTKTKASRRSRTIMRNSSREEKTKARTSMRNSNSNSGSDNDNRSSSPSYECCSKVDFDQVWIKSIGTTTKTVSDNNNDNKKQLLPFENLQEVPDSIMKHIINEVGQRAFLESFAVFPVSFLDSNTIVFEFELLGTKVCAHKMA